MDIESIYTTTDTPIGELLLTGVLSPDGLTLTSVSFEADGRGSRREATAFELIETQLGEYFSGDRDDFEFDWAAKGTEFQERVWAAVDNVPYGRTTSYGELTAQMGASRAQVRAVGAALGANPLLIIRPCHRVIGASGALTGYAGGLERKHFLLSHEGALQPQLG
jgi:methylated-DNA-[protein]-cysteine S-methyltransferase